MVTLASMFVLSEYLTSKDGQHSSGKLRVRGLQIRIVPEQFPNHCEVNVFLVSEDQGKLGKRATFGVNLNSCSRSGANKIFFYFCRDVTDSKSTQREEHFKPIKR